MFAGLQQMFAHKRNVCGTKRNVRILKIISRAIKYIICKSQMFSGAIENVSGIFPQSDVRKNHIC